LHVIRDMHEDDPESGYQFDSDQLAGSMSRVTSAGDNATSARSRRSSSNWHSLQGSKTLLPDQ